MRLEGSYAFDATLRETPTNLPKLPKLLFRNAEYAESAEYNARGRRACQAVFLHNTENVHLSVCLWRGPRVSTTFLALCALPPGWEKE